MSSKELFLDAHSRGLDIYKLMVIFIRGGEWEADT